uniref:Uncharacterized protein n=1 Tax=Tetranychus urticae TaxID=32264 RepID=T1K8S3_TETUR
MKHCLLKDFSRLPHSYHNGPVLEKLKLVELATNIDSFVRFLWFMDSYPNLQKAHITVISRALFVDETLKQESMQDLVIEYCNDQMWNDLKRSLMKYPKFKHFSLRSPEYMTDEHIKQLVHMLPNLVIFDVSRCGGVTQRAASYFYFNGNDYVIESDWPQLSSKQEKISRGYDAMKNCFLKDFHDLPYTSVPIDF